MIAILFSVIFIIVAFQVVTEYRGSRSALDKSILPPEWRELRFTDIEYLGKSYSVKIARGPRGAVVLKHKRL